MDFLDLAKSRFSVRKYKPDAIEKEKLDKIIEAGRVAPTAKNNQPQKIYVALSEHSRNLLKKVCPFTFDAPCVLVIAYDENRCWQNELCPGVNSANTDATIVATHMMLCAHSLGLGSCYVAWFDNRRLESALGLPDGVRVSALMPIGYKADDVVPNERHTIYRDFDDTVKFI